MKGMIKIVMNREALRILEKARKKGESYSAVINRCIPDSVIETDKDFERIQGLKKQII